MSRVSSPENGSIQLTAVRFPGIDYIHLMTPPTSEEDIHSNQLMAQAETIQFQATH